MVPDCVFGVRQLPLLRKEMVRHMNRHGWKGHLSNFEPTPKTGSQGKLIDRLGSFWSSRLFLYLEDGIQDDKNLSKLSTENQKTLEGLAKSIWEYMTEGSDSFTIDEKCIRNANLEFLGKLSSVRRFPGFSLINLALNQDVPVENMREIIIGSHCIGSGDIYEDMLIAGRCPLNKKVNPDTTFFYCTAAKIRLYSRCCHCLQKV